MTIPEAFSRSISFYHESPAPIKNGTQYKPIAHVRGLLRPHKNFAAGCARGLHSTTKLAGPEGENRASNGGGEARRPGCGGRDTQGWSRDKPLDLKTATKEQLLSLPGMTAAEADR
jgi:hypothetical protein